MFFFLRICIFCCTFAVANLRQGMSAHQRRGEQTYERRLLALCSDVLKLRNFQKVFGTEQR